MEESDDVEEGQFVLIFDPEDRESTDNGHVYIKTSDSFVFFIDISYIGESIIGPKGDPGVKGDPGNRGLSAYEVAQVNGFTGTEQE